MIAIPKVNSDSLLVPADDGRLVNKRVNSRLVPRCVAKRNAAGVMAGAIAGAIAAPAAPRRRALTASSRDLSTCRRIQAGGMALSGHGDFLQKGFQAMSIPRLRSLRPLLTAGVVAAGLGPLGVAATPGAANAQVNLYCQYPYYNAYYCWYYSQYAASSYYPYDEGDYPYYSYDWGYPVDVTLGRGWGGRGYHGWGGRGGGGHRYARTWSGVGRTGTTAGNFHTGAVRAAPATGWGGFHAGTAPTATAGGWGGGGGGFHAGGFGGGMGHAAPTHAGGGGGGSGGSGRHW